jgi:hypothetical protein
VHADSRLLTSSGSNTTPASDGSSAKTPDDHVNVDLKSGTLGHFVVNDLGRLD